jgi:uncharacterized protein (TIGR03437 family)
VGRILLLVCALAGLCAAQNRRVLYVTHSAGFRHESIQVSKPVLQEIAARSGRLEIVHTEDLSLISEESLRDFDAVFFFTSGELALSDAQKRSLLEFVRGGKGFGGAHSATDTLYTWPEYGDLIGGYFDEHPWAHEAAIDIEDPDHPLVKHLAPSFRITEEFYQFRAFSRDRVRVLMTLDPRTIDLSAPQVKRTDEDFALAWVRPYGQGRVFYTALGHFDDTWRNPGFQTMLENALLWLTGQAEAESTPRTSTPAARGISTIPAGVEGAFAPGGLIAIVGEGLTTGSSLRAPSLPLPVRLAGTTVRIAGRPAPLLSVSPALIEAQAPYGIAPGSAEIVVSSGITSAGPAVAAEVVPSAPRIVAVTGSRAQGYLSIYCTGLGEVAANVQAGAAAPSDPPATTVGSPSVSIAGTNMPVMFSGLAPGLTGVYQVNVSTAAAASGEVVVEAGGRRSNGVAID